VGFKSLLAVTIGGSEFKRCGGREMAVKAGLAEEPRGVYPFWLGR